MHKKKMKTTRDTQSKIKDILGDYICVDLHHAFTIYYDSVELNEKKNENEANKGKIKRHLTCVFLVMCLLAE